METYVSIEGLADYLKIAEKTIRKWVLNRKVPYHKVGGLVRFRISEIETWVTEGSYTRLADKADVVEGDLLNDAVSLEELAEQELTAGDEEEAGGEV